MRNLVMACAVGAALLAGGLALPSQASAMPLAPVAAPHLVANVDYLCRPVWRCGPFACGWRRFCGWGPGAYYYGPGPYAFARPYWGWRRWGWGGPRPWAYHWGYRRFW